jgi:segregation and condensation protein B
MFEGENSPSEQTLRESVQEIAADYEGRVIELKEVSSGFRFQICQEVSPWIPKLWQERPIKYSRALLETLALIVYRQPITRAEIEEIRGVAVSTTIIKTLMEREWVRIIGHKEVPGKPALYATTKQFLDDFNVKSLSELPPLSEIIDLELLGEKAEISLQLPLMEEDEFTKPELEVTEAELEVTEAEFGVTEAELEVTEAEVEVTEAEFEVTEDEVEIIEPELEVVN